MQYDDYMRHIDLTYNKIGPDSSKMLITKLKNNNSLVCLEMFGNSGYSEDIKK
jgi:hypothetical protein